MQSQSLDSQQGPEHYYHLLVDQLPSTVAIHCEGKIVYINPAGIRLYGVGSENEILGRSAIEFVHPDDRARVALRIGKAMQDGTPAHLSEERFLLPDGRIVYAEVIGIPITFEGKPAMEVIIQDISDRKAAEDVLMQSEEIFTQFLKHSPVYIFFKDDQIRALRLSSNFKEMLGRPVEEMLGKTMYDLFPFDFAKKIVEDDIRVLQEGKEVESEEEFNGRNYTTFKFPIQINGKPRFLAGFTIDVTEKKLAEATLLEREKKYRLLAESLEIAEQRTRALIENAPDGIVMINKEGNFFYASPTASRMFGYYTEDFEKSHPNDLTHPEDLPMVLETLGRLMQKPTLVPTIQYRFRHKNGNWFWIESTFTNMLGTPGIEAIVINFRDITDRKHAVDKLRESEQRSRRLSHGIEQSPAAVVITDATGHIGYVNPKFTSMTGYTFEQVEGKIARILKIDRTPEDVHKQIWNDISSGKVWAGEYLSKKKNGEAYWESVSVAPMFDPTGNITDFIITMEDISERKKMISDLVNARKKAEESDRLKTTFLANMSHEIRTPMNAIVGFAEMLSDPDLTQSERVKFSRIVQTRSDDLMHIINDLLEISRIESGNITVVKSKFLINQVINDIEAVYRQRLQHSNSGVSLFVEKVLPDNQSVIETDVHILKEVFFNLIDNALKYTPSGSIKFGYHAPEGGKVTFFVKDTGIGISSENHALIFEHFRQADIENQQNYSGTGLGLAICKGALQFIDGSIGVDSELGKGSTFYFTLPYAQPASVLTGEASGIDSAIQQQVAVYPYYWPDKRLLIVEDEPTNMEFLTIILKRTQIEITPVATGAMLRSHYHELDRFDVVMLDVRLPDANGWDLAQELKAIRPGLPVIAQTAYAMSTDRQKSEETGCDNYISKPIKKEKLLEMLAVYLKKNNLTRNTSNVS